MVFWFVALVYSGYLEKGEGASTSAHPALRQYDHVKALLSLLDSRRSSAHNGLVSFLELLFS